MSTEISERTGRAAPEMIQDALNTVSSQFEGVSSEIRDQLQGLLHEVNNRRLAVHDANGQILVRMPLIVGLVGGASFFVFMPIRRAILLTVAFLFTGIYFSVEENADRPTRSTSAIRRARRQS